MRLLYLSRSDVEATELGLSEVIDAVRAAFREKGHHRVEMPPKPGIHPRPDAFIHAMPASIPALNAAGMKWVSGYPDNAARGLPYIGGLFVLNDPETGMVRMVCDCTWITAMRTAAATAVAVSHLACEDASTIALLGLGVQGRSHLDALPIVMPALSKVYAYDVVPDQRERFADHFESAALDGVDLFFADGPAAAVRDADVVVTAGPILKQPTPSITRAMLKPEALVCPVDFDSYVAADVLLEADRFYTDDLEQLAYYQTQGYFSSLPAHRTELADVIIGRDTGRTRDDESIVVMNLGIALEDVAVAVRVFERATQRDIGVWLDA